MREEKVHHAFRIHDSFAKAFVSFGMSNQEHDLHLTPFAHEVL